MGLDHATAFYGALNGHWPSYPTLKHFATSCRIRIKAAPPGGMRPIREQAARLLEAEGLTPPTRTRGGGKGKRLTYRYPVAGIPGAHRRLPGDARRMPPGRRRVDDRENPLDRSRRAELRRELVVASLRVWLAGMEADDPRVRAQYVRWQVGTGYASAASFPRFGGFAALKQEAMEENARVRQAGGDPLADAQARVDAIRAETRTIRRKVERRQQHEQPKAVPFADALRAVLAGPHAEAEPPKQ